MVQRYVSDVESRQLQNRTTSATQAKTQQLATTRNEHPKVDEVFFTLFCSLVLVIFFFVF